MSERFDLMVIGGGPAGYLAAERAARSGMRVVLFEKRALGGVCLNEGCIPSKALLNSAKLYEHALHGAQYGIHCGDVWLDQQAVTARCGRVVRTLVNGVKAKLRAAGVTVVMLEVKIDGRDGEDFRVIANGENYSMTANCGNYRVTAGGECYLGRRLLIASGSTAIIPPIPGVQENLGGFVLTNREALELKEVPRRLIVVGGGVIGLEMAAYYVVAGAKVTVIEMLDHIAGSTDCEISTLLQRKMEEKGVEFLLKHKCLSVEKGAATVEAPDGSTARLEADKLLLSIGRRADFAALGLETIGVSVQKTGVITDALGRTNVSGVYAVGDVNGHHMLAHTAYREAEVAVNDMLGKRDSMRYYANPSVIYTCPEIASVGRTEEEAREKGVDYEVQKLSMRYSGRFVAENEGADGLCKILIHKKKRTIIGVHMIGAYCSEIIWGAAEMIEMQLRVEDARQIIFPHPTVSEIIREVLWTFDD